jgi:hypothetical protein
MRSCRLVCALTILFTGIGHAQVTAYAALRTLGSSRGEKVLSQILAVSAEGINAQPAHWRVYVDDPAARGGVRELEVTGNQIVSERTPVKSEWAGAKDMDMTKLNLDSDGAYQTASQEAKKKGISFATVQFQLAVDRHTGKPGWTVQMSDGEQRVGAIKINADSGTLVSSAWGQGTPNLLAQRSEGNADEQFLNSPEGRTQGRHVQNEEEVPPAKAVPAERDVPPRYAQEQENSGDSGQQSGSDSLGDRARRYADGAGNFGRNVVNRLERPFLKAGGWIQKKVTGQDTISPQKNDSDDDDDNDDDNRSNDQYNKPVHPIPQ